MAHALAPEKTVAHPQRRLRAAVEGGASSREGFGGKLWFAVGRLLNFLGAPGAVKPIAIYDGTAAQQINVSVDARHVIISVGTQDYFFDRITGRFHASGKLPG